jgi:hypothetical protein
MKNIICNPIDINGAVIIPPEQMTEHEKFKAWVESIFDNQTNFANRCGYSRKAINQFCQGKKPIPQSLLLVWQISKQNEKIKQEMAKLKRGMK